MLTLIVVLLLIVWLASLAGPRYYPAYTARYRRYPLWGGRSNVLLAVLGLLIILWLLGVIKVDGLRSPLNTRGTNPTIKLP